MELISLTAFVMVSPWVPLMMKLAWSRAALMLLITWQLRGNWYLSLVSRAGISMLLPSLE